MAIAHKDDADELFRALQDCEFTRVATDDDTTPMQNVNRLADKLKELLYQNRVGAGADWLYGLEEWNDIFDEDKRKALYKEQKSSMTVVKGAKVYPNDPCPCGSGTLQCSSSAPR